jgi:hypothetical protein
MKNRGFGQCCLGSTNATLEDFHATTPIRTMLLSLALRALKALGPTSFFNNRLTLGLSAIIGKKLIQAHPGLELDSIHFHGMPP